MLYEAMRKAAGFVTQGNYIDAIITMDNFLSIDIDPETRSEALSFRASLKEDIGDYTSAKEDLLQAIQLSPELSYSRYTIELGLGDVCERLGNYDEAIHWFKIALLTSINGEGISGGSALRSFVDKKGEGKLTEEDKTLCNRVAEKAWKLLEIQGEPDLSNLLKTAEILINVGSNQRK